MQSGTGVFPRIVKAVRVRRGVSVRRSQASSGVSWYDYGAEEEAEGGQASSCGKNGGLQCLSLRLCMATETKFAPLALALERLRSAWWMVVVGKKERRLTGPTPTAISRLVPSACCLAREASHIEPHGPHQARHVANLCTSDLRALGASALVLCCCSRRRLAGTLTAVSWHSVRHGLRQTRASFVLRALIWLGVMHIEAIIDRHNFNMPAVCASSDAETSTHPQMSPRCRTSVSRYRSSFCIVSVQCLRLSVVR